MKKYAKIINEETKQCDVGLGTNTAAYESEGMTEQDVEQADDGSWYIEGYAPVKPKIEIDIDKEKEKIREEIIDKYTLRRIRKMANKTWTIEDEQQYLLLDAKVTGIIEEKFGEEN